MVVHIILLQYHWHQFNKNISRVTVNPNNMTLKENSEISFFFSTITTSNELQNNQIEYIAISAKTTEENVCITDGNIPILMKQSTSYFLHEKSTTKNMPKKRKEKRCASRWLIYVEKKIHKKLSYRNSKL